MTAGILDRLDTGASGRREAQASIINAAVDVFVERGIAATRVADILAAAGVARRTFYKYFDNKHAVLAELYEIITDELVGRITDSVTAGDEPLAAIETALDSYLEVHVSHAAVVRMLIAEAIQRDSPLAPLRAQFRVRVVFAIDAVIAALAGRRLDSMVSVALVSALEGLSLDVLDDGATTADVARVKQTILGLIRLTLAHAAELPGR